MKTLRLIGMALLAVVLCVNFTACSDDDDEPVTGNFEGTWGLTHSKGSVYDSSSGQKTPFEFTCDPYNPENSNCIKIDVKKLSENTYSWTIYEAESGGWDMVRTYKGTLRGNVLTITEGIDGSFSSSPITIKDLSADKMVLVMKDRDWNGDDESDYRETEQTATFVRMK